MNGEVTFTLLGMIRSTLYLFADERPLSNEPSRARGDVPGPTAPTFFSNSERVHHEPPSYDQA